LAGFGLDSEAVIYLGSAAKTLTPAVRVGWLAAQPALIPWLAEAAGQLRGWAGEAAKHAMLTMITTGDLERHIRRMRHQCARHRRLTSWHSGYPSGVTGRPAIGTTWPAA
jgi:GntR family transcriptional regulator/MocR family aminotransferase